MLGRKLTVVTGCCRPKAVIRKLRLVGSNGGTNRPHRFASSMSTFSTYLPLTDLRLSKTTKLLQAKNKMGPQQLINQVNLHQKVLHLGVR